MAQDGAVPGATLQGHHVDNRGVGQSDKPAGPYTAQMLAADTFGFLDALNIEKASVMGHSMGGFIAQAIALDFPQRVAKLILCSTNFGGPHHVPITQEAMKVLTNVTSDALTRFKNGLGVSTAPGWAEKNPEMIEEWVKWRVANPIEPIHYQAQMAIGLGLLPEAAAGAAREDVLANWRQLVALHQKTHALLREMKDPEQALAKDGRESHLDWLKDIQARMAEAEGTEALIEGFGELSGRFQRSV